MNGSRRCGDDFKLEEIESGIVRVGEGRGFLVKSSRFGALVITAGHCLPHLPPAMPAGYTEEYTYQNLLGAIEESALSITAEFLFVDPVGDLAVLGGPDNQTFFDESEAYEEFAEHRFKLAIGRPTDELTEAWLFSRENQWESCRAGTTHRLTLQIEGAPWMAIAPGTSGSPVVLEDGSAVGAISLGQSDNPVLVHHPPGWLLADLGLIPPCLATYVPRP
jgi:hypothetical protein